VIFCASASTRSTTRRSTSSSPRVRLVGYWLIKHDFEPAPLLLGFVLGPLMEENLRRALLISRGDWTVFLTRPLSAGAGGAAVAAQEARRGVRGVRN
jgi:TctA family transporter